MDPHLFGKKSEGKMDPSHFQSKNYSSQACNSPYAQRSQLLMSSLSLALKVQVGQFIMNEFAKPQRRKKNTGKQQGHSRCLGSIWCKGGGEVNFEYHNIFTPMLTQA